MNKMLLRRLLCAALCGTLALALTGCVGGIDALGRKDTVTLPPAETAYTAPTGDTNQEIARPCFYTCPTRRAPG